MTEKEIERGEGENVIVIVRVFLKAVSPSQPPHRFQQIDNQQEGWCQQ